MELQVATPFEFNFDSSCSSPYITAPSSPTHTRSFFFSAPPSPTRISAVFYSDISSVPFNWEAKPGVPKLHHTTTAAAADNDDDSSNFQFDFSGHLDRSSFSELSAADELFHGGVIRPLKPPPGNNSADVSSPSPRSPRSPKSPRKMKDFEIDPFAAAIEETRRREIARTRSRSRSLSPIRVSDVLSSPTPQPSINNNNNNNLSAYSSILSAISYKKWKLKEFLFRSASEGRAPRNDDVIRRAVKSKKSISNNNKIVSNEDVRNSSFRSTESVSSVGSSRRRGPPASAHEIHYTVNRAVSEELKRKTFLPYKQGLLGCLGFSPGVHQIISKRFGSFSRA